MTRVLYAEDAGQHAAAILWRVAVDTHANRASATTLDLYPTPEWDWFADLPEETRQAWQVLADETQRRLGEPGLRSGDPLWRVTLELEGPRLREAIRDYGWASIYIQVFGHDELELITADDSGRMIEIWFDDDQEVGDFKGRVRQRGLNPEELLSEGRAYPRDRLRVGQR